LARRIDLIDLGTALLIRALAGSRLNLIPLKSSERLRAQNLSLRN
jgi:hypothetical protein